MKHHPISELIDPILRDPERRARIEQLERAMDDVMALTKVREQQGLTQQQVAGTLGVSQANISRIEHEEDIYLSTLREYVEALGGELQLKAVFEDQEIYLAVPAKS
jgi:DNA-binding XRE family transcriptional regulator